MLFPLAVLSIGIVFVFEPSLAADVPAKTPLLPSSIDLIYVNTAFEVRYYRGTEFVSACWLVLKSLQKRVQVDLHLVDTFSSKPASAKLLTSSEEEVRLFDESDSLTETQKYSISSRLIAEATKSTPFDAVVDVLVWHFNRTANYEAVYVANLNDTQDRASSYINGIVKSKIRSKEFFHISPFGKTSKITESSLLNVIRTTGATRIEIEKVEPWSVTDAFFQDSTVKKASRIYLQNVEHNAITDDSLASLSLGKDLAQLELGHTPGLTIAGLRRFLQPVLEGKAKQRIIKFVPSFTVSSPRDLFSHVKATQNPNDSAFWTIQRPSERDINFSNTNFQGVKSIWMTVKT